MSDPADLGAAITEMIETPRAVIVDCLVDKMENCFPMIPSGKAHNEMILAEDADVEMEAMIDAKGRELVERLDKGVRIPTTAMPELRVLHPQEFAAASDMASSITAALGRELPPEEAVFLTMHLLNATRDEPNGTAALLFRRVQHVVTTVESGLGFAWTSRASTTRGSSCTCSFCCSGS